MHPDPTTMYQFATCRHDDFVRRAERARFVRLFRKRKDEAAPADPRPALARHEQCPEAVPLPAADHAMLG